MPDRRNELSETTRTVAATPHRIFAELGDGWAYVGWVVGATHIRDVDAEWPAPGSRIHHKIGSWPVVAADTTEVLELDPDRRIVLKARGWPLGEAVVEILAEPLSETESRVTIREAPSAGPGRWIDNPVLRWGLRWRNTETLARLADRVEHRPMPQ